MFLGLVTAGKARFSLGEFFPAKRLFPLSAWLTRLSSAKAISLIYTSAKADKGKSRFVGLTSGPFSLEKNFLTENFPKISLLKVENFQLQIFFRTENLCRPITFYNIFILRKIFLSGNLRSLR